MIPPDSAVAQAEPCAPMHPARTCRALRSMGRAPGGERQAVRRLSGASEVRRHNLALREVHHGNLLPHVHLDRETCSNTDQLDARIVVEMTHMRYWVIMVLDKKLL